MNLDKTSRINTNWFSILNDKDDKDDKDDKKEEEYVIEDNTEMNIEFIKRIESCENNIKSIQETLEKMKNQLDNFLKEDGEIKIQIQDIQKKVRDNETSCNVIRNENLKLINRILEAEISVERTTNILLRKNISFPFTKLNL